jgi:hypothetical protein
MPLCSIYYLDVFGFIEANIHKSGMIESQDFPKVCLVLKFIILA